MIPVRECDWCGAPLTGHKPAAKTCSDHCRLTLSKWRRGIGPFAPGTDSQDATGRRRPHNPQVASEHADRDRMRARRANGQVPSDRRVQWTAAVDACIAAMRQVGSVSAANARVIAEQELRRRASVR